jgi:hypothetical protein
MLIADSQVHIWSANTPERPWAPGTRPHRAEPLGHEAPYESRACPSWDEVMRCQ